MKPIAIVAAALASLAAAGCLAAGGERCTPKSEAEVERLVADDRAMQERSHPKDPYSPTFHWHIRAIADCHHTEASATVDMVVMINATLGDESTAGAGIVVGAADGKLLIATANHVLRRGASVATHIRVRFPAWRQSTVEARVLPQSDTTLDLGVIAVDAAGTQGSTGGPDLDRRYLHVHPAQLSYGVDFHFNNNRYVLADEATKRGDSLAVIGQPGGRAWFVPQQQAVTNSVTGDEILFEQQFLSPGYSGGAIANAKGSLVGMVRSDAPPLGSALPMERIAASFKAWGLPFFLKRYNDVWADANRCKRQFAPDTNWRVVNPFLVVCEGE